MALNADKKNVSLRDKIIKNLKLLTAYACLLHFAASARAATPLLPRNEKSTFNRKYAANSRQHDKGVSTNSRVHAPEEMDTSKLRWEIRLAPLVTFFQMLPIDLSYAIHDKITFGPSLILYTAPRGSNSGMLSPARSGQAIGFNINYYFNSDAQKGWYIGSHAYIEKYSIRPHATINTLNEFDGFNGNLLIGHKSIIQGHWTLLIGGGFMQTSGTDKETKTDTSGNPQTTTISDTSINGSAPFIEAKLGYLF